MQSKSYFAADGSFGDAADIVILNTSDWTEQEWDEIDSMGDSERFSFVLDLDYAIKMQDCSDL